jgi:hypothetical protein
VVNIWRNGKQFLIQWSGQISTTGFNSQKKKKKYEISMHCANTKDDR